MVCDDSATIFDFYGEKYVQPRNKADFKMEWGRAPEKSQHGIEFVCGGDPPTRLTVVTPLPPVRGKCHKGRPATPGMVLYRDSYGIEHISLSLFST